MKKGKMNIEFDEVYDQDSDIYYVSFKTGEPSFATEIDDVLLIERGIFTGMPTGFRILNYTKNPIQEVQFFVQKIQKTINRIREDLRKEMDSRQEQMEQSLEKVLSS